MIKVSLLLAATSLMLTACSSASDGTSDKDKLAATLSDVRVGEEVRQICFNRSIDGFSKNTRRSVVLSKGINDKFLVTVSGSCPTLSYAQSIGLDSTSSCVGRGDILIVSDSAFGLDNGTIRPDRCFIRDIYNWNEDAEEADEDDVEAE